MQGNRHTSNLHGNELIDKLWLWIHRTEPSRDPFGGTGTFCFGRVVWHLYALTVSITAAYSVPWLLQRSHKDDSNGPNLLRRS